MNEKVYLGEGVYAEYDANYIILSVKDEEGYLREIYLDDSVFYALLDFAKKIDWMASDPCNKIAP